MSRVASFLSLCAVSLVGCGDNLDGPGGPGPDAAGAEPITGIAVAGDFRTTGVLSRIDVPARTVQIGALALVAGAEPWIRRVGDELFIVNRVGGENVTILRRSPLQLVDQLAAGGGSLPQDVAVAGSKLYVPALGTAGVVVIDRVSRQTKTVSLASLDPDGKPDCVAASAVGGQVYVACGLLDENYAPRGNGKVAVIDTSSDTVVTSFDLPGLNPQGLFAATPPESMFGGDLLIQLTPSFTDMSSGCLARVRTTGTPGANGCALTNTAMDGYVNHLDVAPDGAHAWLAIFAYDNTFSTRKAEVRALDLATGQLADPISVGTRHLLDVAACPGGYVVATEKDRGVRVFKDGTELTPAAMNIGLPPKASNGLVCY